MLANPYTPGAGFMPAYLAGRDKLIADAENCLRNIQKRYPQQSIIYYGLRGVGKTVLLNAIELSADNLNILYAHIEASGDDKFSTRLTGAITRFLREVSMKEAAKDLAQKCLTILKSFMFTYSIEDNSVGIGLSKEATFSTGVYSDDLTELLVSLGKAAVKSGDTICIFIDEVQYLKENEISGLIMAIHRCNQLRLPIMVYCAGLPKILKTVGEACSYSERLFKFQFVDALSNEEAAEAIRQPAGDFDVSYTDDAVKYIIGVTEGYPYFIQEYCNSIWNSLTKAKAIQLDDVQQCEATFLESLDKGFFSVRYDRCTPRERDFMIAMVRCGELPCTISNVAKKMKRSSSSISPIRGQLISKGMIFATGHAEIDFTVPQFDDFIQRINPKLEMSI